MSQYIKPLDVQDGEQRYEVVMLAAGKDGSVVESINPLPVTLGSENITITGSVNIGTTVTVTSSPEEPVHSHITEIGTSGVLDIPNLPISIQDNDGNINSVSYPIFANVVNLPEMQTVAFKVGTADAFGRVRVSEPLTLADYSHVYGVESELLTQLNGVDSSQTLRPNEASTRLTVGTGSTDYVIHQSRMHHHYMPGKSQLAYMSFMFGASRTNTVKRIGLFGEEDGVYFQQAGNGTLQFVKRTSITGVTVDETPIPQSSWNVDPCDGTGPSGFNLLIDKTQLFFCDYQWLGVGRLRVGFIHNGDYIVAHEYRHSNNTTTVYWRNPNLPVRCEIRNTGTAVGTAFMDQICSSVMSEGGYVESGVNLSTYAENIPLIKGAPGVAKCLIAIKLKNTYNSLPNRSIIRMTDIELLSDGAPVVFELWRLPSASSNITGGTWVSAGAESVVEYNTSVGANFNTTGAEMFASGFVAANNPSGKQASGSSSLADPAKAKRAYLSQNILSTDSNVFAIVARNLSSTADTNTFSAMQWLETR